MKKWQGKTALVTGAASGIGRSIAVALGSLGLHVLLVGRRETSLQETLHLVEQAGGSGAVVLADLLLEDDFIARIQPALEQRGTLDVLVHNAGIASFGGLEIYTPAQVRNHYWMHAGVPLLLSQLALPFLKKANGAHIVNIGSDQGIRPNSYNSLYGSSKAALHFLTKSLAAELADARIRVNAIAPGPVDTDLLRSAVGDAEVVTPLGRIFQPEEIAQWVVHLISVDMTTGSVLVVDGGTTL